MATTAPRPLRTAAPLVVLAAGALAFDADPRLPWIAGVAGAAFFAGAAAVRALQASNELRHMRRTADRLILEAPHEQYELTIWRSRELTAPRTRDQLRRELDRTQRSLSAARLPSASPLNRPAARRSADLLHVLAERIGDDEPVAARGVLLVRQLLRSPSSPLYSEGADVLLPRELTRALAALEP
jgi:hypothetical protein